VNGFETASHHLQSTIDNQQSTHPHSILTPAAAGFMLLAIAFVKEARWIRHRTENGVTGFCRTRTARLLDAHPGARPHSQARQNPAATHPFISNHPLHPD